MILNALLMPHVSRVRFFPMKVNIVLCAIHQCSSNYLEAAAFLKYLNFKGFAIETSKINGMCYVTLVMNSLLDRYVTCVFQIIYAVFVKIKIFAVVNKISVSTAIVITMMI